MKKWKIYLIAAIVILCFIIWTECSLNTSKLLEMTEDVKTEFYNTKHMPESEIVQFNATRKIDNAYVDADFAVDASYDDIKNYYLNELKQEGWTFENETVVKEWGKDVDDKALDFTKGTYALELFYVGNPDSSYQYAISISWKKD